MCQSELVKAYAQYVKRTQRRGDLRGEAVGERSEELLMGREVERYDEGGEEVESVLRAALKFSECKEKTKRKWRVP